MILDLIMDLGIYMKSKLITLYQKLEKLCSCGRRAKQPKTLVRSSKIDLIDLDIINIPSLKSLVFCMYEEWCKENNYPQIDYPSGHIFLCLYDGKSAGYLCYDELGNNHIYARQIYVKPDFRNTLVAERLYRKLMKVRKLNEASIICAVDDNTSSIWRRKGWKPWRHLLIRSYH